MKTKTSPTTNSMSRSLLGRPLLLIPLLVVCFVLLPRAQAVLPAPDGGYAGGNTAEGTQALFSLTTGSSNTAMGFNSLYSNTTGFNNTATGFGALGSNTTGTNNTATGFRALFRNTASENTANGAFALLRNTTGDDNMASGQAALVNNTTGSNNTANGYGALYYNTTGSNNTADGSNALFRNTTGHNNIALGVFAGSLLKGDNNIDIGNAGGGTESSTIRIGTQGTQTRTFVAGIHGATTGGMSPLPVLIDVNGQLGTLASSRRFKNEIKPMDGASEAILALKPVSFQYKSDSRGTTQFGLIAEDVEKVNPDLVVRDEEGKPYSVRYDQVNAMLLNEFLKEHRKNEEQQARITRLEKQIEALTAGLQKVSAQLELSKSAPQTVLNTQ